MELVGHRGMIDLQGPLENTVAAVEAALAAGADGVEVDARLTADGVPVCLHDADLLRISGFPSPVRLLTYDQLRRVPLLTGEVVPRLAEVAEAVRGRGRLIVDAKDDEAYPETVAAPVVAVLRQAGLGGDAVLSSFSDRVLQHARRIDPQLSRALITGPLVPATDGLRRAVAAGHGELHAHVRSVLADHHVVDRAGRHGVRLRCWTVNREPDARLLAVTGVAGVITDDPARIGSALADRPLERSAR